MEHIYFFDYSVHMYRQIKFLGNKQQAKNAIPKYLEKHPELDTIESHLKLVGQRRKGIK